MMAKKASVSKPKLKKSLPDHLVLAVDDPLMDGLLRAGIGGLAATLHAMERDKKWKRPETESWSSGDWPWTIASDHLVIRFPKPDAVIEVLQPIFEYAFRIDAEEMIDLPSIFPSNNTDPVYRSQLQRGLLLTFLQHGKSRNGAKADVEKRTADDKQRAYSYRPIYSYKHQRGYEDLIDTRTGGLTEKIGELPGTLYPGAAVRHNAYAGYTKQEATAAQLLAGYFSAIGTLSLPINRGSAVLLVPEPTDLKVFANYRAKITPKDALSCCIGGTGDAVMQVYARMRSEEEIKEKRVLVSTVHAYLFRPTAWAKQQKSRVDAITVAPLDDRQIEIFEYARAHFQPRQVVRKEIVKGAKGQPNQGQETWFYSDSIVRPLIAENLANNRYWFSGFSRLFVENDPANGKPLRDRLLFEKKGLLEMTQSNVWDHEGHQALVRSVHHALRGRYGRIASENEKNPVAMRNRFRGEYDRLRLAFSGAKTADQFRQAICDLFSRVPANTELQANWTSVLPMLDDRNWQHARDLALLAMASYSGKGDKELLQDEEVALSESA
jgi:CRISPR-associated protein Cas8a1/Csx13